MYILEDVVSDELMIEMHRSVALCRNFSTFSFLGWNVLFCFVSDTF